MDSKKYEPHVTKSLRSRLAPGMVFLDVGANIGYFTLLAASIVGPQGKVIAIEPYAENCALLTRSMEVNGFKNIELHPYAAAECEKSLNLIPVASSLTAVLDWAPIMEESVSVRGVALDSLLEDLEQCDILKMDIDGGEPNALRGLEQLIRRHRPLFFFEFAPILMKEVSKIDPDSFLDQIYALGYDLFIIERNGPVSSKPQSKEQIQEAFIDRGYHSHLDLLGVPQSTAGAKNK